MSNVQSPKSKTAVPDAAEARGDERTTRHDGEADFGLWTSDFGLRVSDLRKSFLNPNGERIAVLRGASFSVNAGESVAIVGASGAGKSTLLNLLGGLEAPDHGSIVAGKVAIEGASQSALAHFRNQQVGFVFQFHHLLPDLTAVENVSLPLLIRRMQPREAFRHAMNALEEVGLERQATHLVGSLSGGEQQRVALCRALVHRPQIVFADEPTGNLDATIADEIARSLVAYAKKLPGIVILATHSHDVAALCDRILTLHDGRILAPNEVKQ
ncbi:MAG TPA: ABC transporter ATP-binding protein [Pyrinomonadaceae bacterium]|nr:ABC transporter ATP-binding protein [Pyrinomonadaceae bacterium]